MKPAQAELIDRALISPPERIEITCGSGVKPVLRLIVLKLGSELASCAWSGATANAQKARIRQRAGCMKDFPRGKARLSKSFFDKSSIVEREWPGLFNPE